MRRFAAAVLVLLASSPAFGADGWRAIDGDTIISPAGEHIRIANIDAAELHCQCPSECALAQRAKAFAQVALSSARAITLAPYVRDRDRHNRKLAYVLTDGRDLGERLIAAGLARPWTGRRRPWCPVSMPRIEDPALRAELISAIT